MHGLVKIEEDDLPEWRLDTDKAVCFFCRKELTSAYYCPLKKHVYCSDCEKESINRDCGAHSLKEVASNEGHTHYFVIIRVASAKV